VVQDGPIPIGAFIDGNATFHLQLHHEQIKALEPQWAPDAAPDEFDTYQLILLVRPPDQPELEDEASAALGLQHLGHFRKMRAAGFLLGAGPVEGDSEIAGICFYQAGSLDRARRLAEDDPAVRAGRFAVRAMTWYTTKGALTWRDILDAGAGGGALPPEVRS
ncbi:MAG TPA: YciI family protein, partial [Streptosporangiaceae bacterium]|nr:YciI family protein [Streptosporangiaceae bacterium]